MPILMVNHSITELNTDENSFYMTLGLSTPTNQSGNLLDIEINDEYYVFSGKQLENGRAYPAFVYNDNSMINNQGVITNANQGGYVAWQQDSTVDKKRTIKITDQKPDAVTAGITASYLELTDAAKVYYAKHGEFPPIKYTLRIRNPNNGNIFESSTEAKIKISGTVPDFSSIQDSKEEPKEGPKEEPKTPAEESKEAAEKPVETPNTGFAKIESVSTIGLIGLLSTLIVSTIVVLKNRNNKIKF